MTESRLSLEDPAIVELCNKIGAILDGQNVSIVLAALSEMMAFGLSNALDISEDAGAEQHDKARGFVADFMQAHIKHITEVTGTVVTAHLLSQGSEALN